MFSRLISASFARCLVSLLGSLVWAGPVAAACSAGSVLESVAETTPNADFVNLENGTVAHLKTGLIWKRCAEGQSWDGSACGGEPARVAWSAALQLSVQSGFAGAADWRVPNRKELESIIEYCGHSPAINQFQFPPTPSERFWSSTSFVADPGLAWDVYFSDGYSGISNKSLSSYAVRLVRTAPVGALLTAQTITFDALDQVLVGGTGTLTAAASSGLPVTLMSQTPAVCSIAGTTVSGIAAGVCVIGASQPGNGQFYPTEASKQLVVGKLSQTVSFGNLPDLGVGAAATVIATASSGLPVILSSTSPAVCSVVGNQVSGIAAGACSLTASQAGNGTYQAATPVSATLTVGVSEGQGGGGDPGFSYPMALSAGWHLLGNSLDVPIPVPAIFGDAQKVESVWAWVPAANVWAFYSPLLDSIQLSAYLTAKRFQPLAEIRPGQAYWLKMRQSKDFGPQAGAPWSLRAEDLMTGWNLVTTGDAISPAMLNAGLAPTPPAPGSVAQSFVSLWAWDPVRGRWLFYAPALEAAGTGKLKEYTDSKGFLDFATEQQTVGQGRGFWIRK